MTGVVSEATLDDVTFDSQGLIPAVVQHVETGEVRMVGYMNRAALERTLSSGRVWFWSRSRQSFWMKGESSGNILETVEVRLDCDGDVVLVLSRPHGPTCHTGEESCFFRRLAGASDE